MHRFRLDAALLAFAATFALLVEARLAESGERKTLLQWNYGNNSEGGPDLNAPLVTDRPDFTEASSTVGWGVTQLEMGYTYTRDSAGGDSTSNHSFPETLLRMGVLAEWLELRVDWSYAIERTEIAGAADTADGGEDLVLGVKIGLTPQADMLPETGIILQVSVPTGGDAFSSDEVLPGVNYLYGWDLSEDWDLGGSTGINGATDDDTADTYSEISQSFTLGYQWNERVHSYTEWYVLSPISADTNRAENYFNGGFTVLINNDIQWDIRAGVGLNESADDFFAGTGLSLRYF